MRGLFTAGVMDVLMEYGAEFDAIVGVSAGAAFGVNYKSKQIGRVIRYNKRFANDKRYCSVQSLLNTGNLFNAMFCYHTVPNELDKFDRERYNADKTPFYVVCTDAETGEPVYHLLDRANDWGFEWIRASASLPLVSKPVKIDGKYYLDGGMSDSIPIEFMIVGGCENADEAQPEKIPLHLRRDFAQAHHLQRQPRKGFSGGKARQRGGYLPQGKTAHRPC